MEPSDIAEIVLDRVIYYCGKNYLRLLQCVADHSPDQLSVFAGSYLIDEDKDIKEAIQNADQALLKAIEEEYEKLWKEKISGDVGDSLGDTLKLIVEGIIQDDELDDASKVGYLEVYDKVLYKFIDAIKHALKDSKPLSGYDLYKWYMKIGEAVSINTNAYSEEVGYFVHLYNILENNAKLNALSILLDDIDAVLYDIEERYMGDLGALTNNNS